MRQLTFALLTIFSSMLLGQNNHDMALANGLADRGQHIQAIDAYIEAYNNGNHSSELLFNLGNSYLALDSVAKAILSYERGLLVDPLDKDIFNNLEIARNKIPDRLTEIKDFTAIEWWKQNYRRYPANIWAMLSVALGLLLLGLAYITFYKSGILSRRWSVTLSVILVTAFLFVMISGISRKSFSSGKNVAIIVQDTFMKSGPDERSDDLKQLYAGYKLWISDELDGWYKVRTVDREVGWIDPTFVEMLAAE